MLALGSGLFTAIIDAKSYLARSNSGEGLQVIAGITILAPNSAIVWCKRARILIGPLGRGASLHHNLAAKARECE